MHCVLVVVERKHGYHYSSFIMGYAYPGTYCRVLPVQQQYSDFLNTYNSRSRMKMGYCIVQAYGGGCVEAENTLVCEI
jgi:hypothetical protein